MDGASEEGSEDEQYESEEGPVAERQKSERLFVVQGQDQRMIQAMTVSWGSPKRRPVVQERSDRSLGSRQRGPLEVKRETMGW